MITFELSALNLSLQFPK